MPLAHVERDISNVQRVVDMPSHPMQVSVNEFAGAVFLGPGLSALHEADGVLAAFLERAFDLQRFHHCRSAIQWLEAI